MSKWSEWLGSLCSAGSPVLVFLVNGVKLKGCIVGSDEQSLVLELGGKSQLVERHAVSTVAVDVGEGR